MRFSEVVDQAIEFLRRRERVSYRALKREFDLDDEALEDLKTELIDAQRIAADEDGKILVWTSASSVSSSTFQVPGSLPPSPQILDAGLRTPDAGQLAAERRQLTVMFIDLVGSTMLSQQLDPEDYHARVVAYQTACHQVIARYEGHIAQYLGDGVLAYFGYPTAHEDNAVRAVRSGLEIVTAVSALKVTPPLQVRVGIHTGSVMISEIGAGEHTERLALGETPNIAARVQGTAQPDQVLISAATYRLVEGLFVCEDRGQPELKGVAVPLTLYRVAKESEAQSRFQVVARQGLTPLVGREHEYGMLQDRWQRVKDGAGQIVLLSGEPGIGKSRLVEALKERVEHEGSRCVELRCSPYAQNSALQPIIEHVQRTLHFRPEDSAEDKVQKLIARAQHVAPLPEATALLAALLTLPHPPDAPPLSLSPQKQKEKTYEVLVAWLCAAAKQQSVTYAWEDLHWADPSTLEFLTLFLQRVPTTRLLVVLTYRPDFVPPWGAHSYLSQVPLSRLAQSHIEVMVNKITGGKTLPAEIVGQITGKTDGVPLFVEELTKMVVESGLLTEVNGHYELTGPLPPLAIPSTLQDSLMARLDRLGAAKEIAQLGASIGREFNCELLQAVSPLDAERVQSGLTQLVDAELLYQRGVPPRATYLFKHALIQDTAYQSLLKSRRQQYHRQIAQVLEARFAETKDTQPELLAHHYTEANLIAQAIPYWQKAGERATQRSANVEAINHFTQGLGLLKTQPDTPERAQQELALQVALATPFQATKGWAAPEVEQAYTRARELCQRVGETPEIFPILWGLFLFYLVRAEFQPGRELGKQLYNLAHSIQDPILLLEAHLAMGSLLFHLGESISARGHLEQGIALYNLQQHRSLAFLYGTDPGVHCLSYASWVLWVLGYPDQALQRSQEALTLAHELSHPFMLAFSLDYAATFHQFRRERQAVQKRTAAAIQLCAEQRFVYYLTCESVLQGWVLAEQGQGEEGVAQIRQAVAAFRAMGAGIRQPLYLALLAEACGKAGQAKEGLRAVSEALMLVDNTGQCWYEAELYRIKGELTLQSKISPGQVKPSQDKSKDTDPRPLTPAPQGEAEACFLKAIEVARRQQAKSLELRAVMSLVRLRQRQVGDYAPRNTQHVLHDTQHEARQKLNEAHEMLAEIYGWFTEGFDTKDLQEAKALLDKLSERG